jgi:alkaline phosphatase D
MIKSQAPLTKGQPCHPRERFRLAVLNPKTRYFDVSRHGYPRVDVNRERRLTEARTVDAITTRTSAIPTTAQFVVESGRPGIFPA